MATNVKLSVSEFVEICNQSLEYAFGGVTVEGEVASFKVNQGKWVFFDLKDDETSVNCFLPITSLHVALVDGMKVQVRATPKLTKWGRFSLTVRDILPVGEGNIKKSFELLKQKLAKEGLFDPTKKRPLPPDVTKIGVISSTAAAGYLDFLKILDNRWGGLQVQTINTQVQGLPAIDQILRALDYFNQKGEVEVITLLRGGGSADDLAIFNDERLVRAVAASRLPVLTGIGHEVDESLVDLAADVRASTPSNAAERLTPDRQAVLLQLQNIRRQLRTQLGARLAQIAREQRNKIAQAANELKQRLARAEAHLQETRKLLESLNPDQVLARGYAILSGKISPGQILEITTYRKILTAEVKNVKPRA